MFSQVFILWILQILRVLCNFNVDECLLKAEGKRHSEGNVMIAAFVPFLNIFLNEMNDYIHKEKFDSEYSFKDYQYLLVFIFAIEEINRNPHLLPNTSLGFELYVVQRREENIMMQTLTWLTGMGINIPNYSYQRKNKAVAVLTGASWTTSANIGRLLDLYKYPQLSFGPFHPNLSDRSQFSSLYQIATKDTSLAFGIASLMIHFNWTWVGLILTDNSKGTQILSDVRREMDRNRVCVAFIKMMPEILTSFHLRSGETLKIIIKSTAKVVVVYDDTGSYYIKMLSLFMWLVTWKVWVMNSQWDIGIVANYFLFDPLHGSLYFVQHHGKIHDFQKFVKNYNPSKYPEDHFLAVLWNTFFNCFISVSDCKILGNCQYNFSLEYLPVDLWLMEMTEESYNVYNSMYAVAHSLHEMILQQTQFYSHQISEKKAYPWELNHFLQNVNFKSGDGSQVTLNSQGKLDAEYDIFNFVNFPNGLRQKMKVGVFSPKAPQQHQLSLSDDMIQWATGFTEIPHSLCSESCVPGFRKSLQEGKAACCYKCTPCAENEVSNETDVDNCVKCPESHYANREKNHCLQKAETFLGYEDPLGMVLTCMSLSLTVITAGVLGVFVKYHNTPIVKANNQALTYILLIILTCCFVCPLLFIGYPNKVTCILQQSIYGGLFTVALSTVFAKTLTVVLAFKVTIPGRMMRWFMLSRAPNFIIPICTLIHLVLCGIWLSTSPPFVDSDLHSEHGHIIIVCNKGSAIAFYCVLGYLCCLALGSYTMAYFSMNLPDTFNEARFLAFSMLVFFSVWVTFFPVYHSTKGKVMVAMEIFSILASSLGLLGCIFAPKCYIILFRPDRNSLYCIRDKPHSKQQEPNISFSDFSHVISYNSCFTNIETAFFF
ncbi:vomeronasal type-2 receptor 116-like [Apodemus sylvaticus]|uniref:vomeronasal type-2 receptor 116-like n=1 Tax=Apodemus sylvaticus TaxID=10129 RepID=UPI0022445F1C|nr:vomeronasal type-2 receptor 116-like [Apodemus sylvaticus]